MKFVLLVLLLCSFCGLRSVAAVPAPRPPNVLVILADDQGWGDLGFNGNTSVATPHLDALARAGAVLDRFYVSPVCSPTRAEFLTGRYHPRGGVTGVQAGNERLNLDEHTIAQTFRAAGYATALFGKWHNGGQWPYHPNARGFDEFYGVTQGHWPRYFDAEVEHNGRRVRSSGYLTDDLAQRASDFMAARGDRPFFCFLALPTPHSPLQVPDEHFEKFAAAAITQHAGLPAAENLAFTRAVLAMTENIDANLGRLFRRLDELKIADDTIIVYFSDNGPNSVRWNGGMKGRKASVDEGGVRSPCFIRWPGRIRPGTVVPQIAAAIDLLPTLADLAGLAPRVAPSLPLDGVSLKPLLVAPAPNASAGGGAPVWPERLIFSTWNGKISVRSAQHRLDAAGALFDMVADPGQTRDLAATEPAVATRLAAAVAAWKNAMPSRAGSVSRPYPVGHRAMPFAELPAGEGTPVGGVKRSARYPNSSYFLNWSSLDDRLTWPVEVATAGRYRVTVYYACPHTDVGSTIELSLGSTRLTAQLTEPHDPPLLGAAEDRVERDESYTKEFRPFALGTIALSAGPGTLTLRAVKIPGRQVMEVQAVALELLP